MTEEKIVQVALIQGFYWRYIMIITLLDFILFDSLTLTYVEIGRYATAVCF